MSVFWIHLTKGNVWLSPAEGVMKIPSCTGATGKKPSPVQHLHCPVSPSQSPPSTLVPWHWHYEEHICKENICVFMILKFLFHLEAKGWHLHWSKGSKHQRDYSTYTDTGSQNTRVCSHLLVTTGKGKEEKNIVSA